MVRQAPSPDLCLGEAQPGGDTGALAFCGTVVRKYVFIWLPQTSVTARGTLSLHCSMGDLFLAGIKSTSCVRAHS